MALSREKFIANGIVYIWTSKIVKCSHNSSKIHSPIKLIDDILINTL